MQTVSGLGVRAAVGGTVLLALLVAGAAMTTEAAAVTATIVAVADMNGCTTDGQPTGSRLPADLVAGLPGDLAVVGDAVQSPSTTLQQFQRCYDPAWGRFNGRVRPVPGNHEYLTPGAAGFFDYFGSRAGPDRRGYYSYTAGDWLVLALNSNCDDNGGCGPGSPMYEWLASTLAASSARCQLAYWHHPRWSQSEHGNSSAVGALYSLLYQNRVELLLSGHDHTYQRFAALDPSGSPDPDGVTQIVIGTGGASRYSFTSSTPAPLVRNNDSFGVLALQLTADGWSAQFRPEAGATFQDSSSGSCRGTGTTTSTTAPGGTTTTTTTGTDTQEPDSRITSPAAGSTVSAPITFTGTATDDVGVSRVRVSVRNTATQLWLQADGSFGSTFRQIDATLGTPGGRSTTWTLTRSVPSASYGVGSKAVDTGGRVETSTPWATFTVSGTSPTTTATTTTTAPPGSTTTTTTTMTTTTTSTTTTTTTPATTTTAVASTAFDDRWAFWGYLYADGKRQSSGTYRWDQSPYRYAESAARFQRGAAVAGIGLRQDAAGAWYTTTAVSIPDPSGDPAAVRPFLAASIEGEAICSGMVFDNFSLPMVQYVAGLYGVVGVPATIRTYSRGFNELFVASTSWPELNTWPYATTVRTPGAPDCSLTSK